MTANKLKANVKKLVDLQRNELIELSLKIHANPELGFKEDQASLWLTTYLKNNGFKIRKGVGSLPTAFKASYGNGKPVIALVAEYDALPQIGHACGHNIIATSAVGAAVASKCIVDNYHGTVMVIGTPAEEIYGGKLILLKNKVFNDVDVAMMVHPGVRNMAIIETLACVSLIVEFFGKAAHAASKPEEGINALEAMVLSFSAINSLRQHIKEKSRVHGIITHGGDAPNVVPSYTRAELLVRAPDIEYLEEFKHKVLHCFIGASVATGARLEYEWADDYYAPMKNNSILAELFSKNLESLKRKLEPLEVRFIFGSTDMGNVSQIVPSVHGEIAIASQGTLLHTEEFARAAVSKKGNDGLLDAAKAQAMTIVDLLSTNKTLAMVREDFLTSCRKS